MGNPSKVLSTVLSVFNFGEGVYQVTFAIPQRYTRFLPGQFLHLTLDDFDPSSGYWPESRVFSIASAPRQEHVTVAYSVKGSYTARMERELVTGRQVWLKLPYGDFVIDESKLDEGPLVLIAGGTGVSPYWPFLIAQPERQGEVHLFYGIRKPEQLLFRNELSSMSNKAWFQCHLMVEDGTVEGLAHGHGRLSVGHVVREVGPGLSRANIYLSGPPSMIGLFRDDLRSRGLPAEQIHVDSWE